MGRNPKFQLLVFPLSASVSVVLGAAYPYFHGDVGEPLGEHRIILVGAWFGLALVVSLAIGGLRSPVALIAVFLVSAISGAGFYEIVRDVTKSELIDNGTIFGFSVPEREGTTLLAALAALAWSLCIWGVIAVAVRALRTARCAFGIFLAVAVLGFAVPLALDFANRDLGPASALLHWQVGIAAIIGYCVVPALAIDRKSGRHTAGKSSAEH